MSAVTHHVRLGDTQFVRGQRYVCTGWLPHVGNELTILLEWASHCADCGRPFAVLTSAFTHKFEPNRRCAEHKAPGRRAAQWLA